MNQRDVSIRFSYSVEMKIIRTDENNAIRYFECLKYSLESFKISEKLDGINFNNNPSKIVRLF